MDGGGSHDKCAPSGDFEILIADGAPGKPGRHVLNDEHCVFCDNDAQQQQKDQQITDDLSFEYFNSI